MNIIIHTTKGREKYLKKCLASCKESGIKPIVIGNSPEEDNMEANSQKASYGFWKALTHDPYHDALILEDDVILNKGWWYMFSEFKKLIKSNRYMISLILPFPELVASPEVKVPVMQMMINRATIHFLEDGTPKATPILYSNTSAVFYSKLLLQTRLPEFIYKYCVKGKSMYDLALGYFMFMSQLPIYIITPSIAKNIGDITSMDPKENKNHAQGYDDWGSFKI